MSLPPFRLSVPIEIVGRPFRQALAEVAKLGVSCIRIDPVGELTPAGLTETGRRELRTLVRSYHLDIGAIRCPLRHGLDVPTDLQQRLDRIHLAMRLGIDLGCTRIVLPLPKIHDEEKSLSAATTARESISHLLRLADRLGVLLAFEPGLDDGKSAREYLARYDSGSLCVNFDPANFILNGFDPMSALTALAGAGVGKSPIAGKIVHTHARDARRVSVSGGPQEVAVGAGDIDWISYLATLDLIGYHGDICVERAQGENRFADVAAGVEFLRRFLPTN